MHGSKHIGLLVTTMLIMAACSNGASTTTSSLAEAAVTTVTPATSTTTSAPATTTTTVVTTTSSTVVTTTSSTVVTTTSSSTTTPPVAVATLVLAGNGLVLQTGDATFELPFGSAQDGVITAVESALGPAVDASPGSEECPNGVDWVTAWDAISLDFSDGQFLSWALRPDSTLTDQYGIGLGSSVAEIQANYDASVFVDTLGPEFFAGAEAPAMGGLLSDETDAATITLLWGGFICAFR